MRAPMRIAWASIWVNPRTPENPEGSLIRAYFPAGLFRAARRQAAAPISDMNVHGWQRVRKYARIRLVPGGEVSHRGASRRR
jgi:hypothetical protein